MPQDSYLKSPVAGRCGTREGVWSAFLNVMLPHCVENEWMDMSICTMWGNLLIALYEGIGRLAGQRCSSTAPSFPAWWGTLWCDYWTPSFHSEDCQVVTNSCTSTYHTECTCAGACEIEWERESDVLFKMMSEAVWYCADETESLIITARRHTHNYCSFSAWSLLENYSFSFILLHLLLFCLLLLLHLVLVYLIFMIRCYLYSVYCINSNVVNKQ